MRSYLTTFFTLLVLSGAAALAQTPGPTSFSYQGQLKEDGQLADGAFDYEFSLYTSVLGGTLLGIDQHLGVAVVEGLFTVNLDFGDTPFSGQPVWLETRVTRAGAGGFTTLEPRQALVAAPQAIYSHRAGIADDADRLDGLDADDFLLRAGDTVAGNLDVNGGLGVNGTLTAGTVDVEGGDIELDITRSLRSENGARITTGPNGWTFQFHPGTGLAHIAAFNDSFGNPRVIIDKDGQVGIGTFNPNEMLSVTGNIEVGGVCFRPRQLVRCWIPSGAEHLTWLDNATECTNAGGVVESQIWVLGEC